MKLKRQMSLLIMLGLFQHSFAQKINSSIFTLTGNVQNADSVLLSYHNGNQDIKLSKPLVHQKFKITGNIKGAVKATILLKRKGETISDDELWKKAKYIYLEPTDIHLSGTSTKWNVSGSKAQKDMEDLDRKTQKVLEEMKPILAALKNEQDHEKATEIAEQLNPFYNRLLKINYDFSLAHPNSPVALEILQVYASRLTVDSVKNIFNRLSPALKASNGGKAIEKQIRIMESGMPGRQAADFTAKDINGKMLSLSDFKGKYVLVDFWASWCVPCRKGNPHLIKLYNMYKDKGFEIIGISDDDKDEGAWKKAVEMDNIGIWRHILRGYDVAKRRKGIENPNDISEKYGIGSLPTKILVGPDGKILGRYGGINGASSEELDQILAKTFK